MPKKNERKNLTKAAQRIANKNKQLEDELINHKIAISNDNIKQILKKLDKKNFHEYESTDFDKKVFANYRGAWLFDIIYSRGLIKKSARERRANYPEAEYPREFPIFMNTNSGYTFYYATNNQSKADLQSFQKQFKHDLQKKFPNYPIVSIQSDEQTGWDNSGNYLGDKVKVKKFKDTFHVIMSKINVFAKHMRKYIYNKEGRFDPENDPIKLHRFEEFIQYWNSLKVPGMECTREEMMRDEKKEILYIANALYGNVKKQEFLDANKFEEDDVVQIKAPYNDKLTRNKQQESYELAPGVHKVIAQKGNMLTVQNVADPSSVHTIHRRNVATVNKHALAEVESMIEATKAEVEKKDMINKQNSKSHYIPSKPFKTGDKLAEAEHIYNAEQKRWENIGYPSEWSAEKRYKALQEILDKIEDSNKKNLIIGPVEIEKIKKNKRAIQEITKRYVEQTNKPLPWLHPLEQNISGTDGYDKSEKILSKRGRPRKVDDDPETQLLISTMHPDDVKQIRKITGRQKIYPADLLNFDYRTDEQRKAQRAHTLRQLRARM